MRPVLLLLALAAACDRGHPRESPKPGSSAAAAPAPAAPAPAAPGCTLAALPHELAMPKRLVAIGDLHGDLAATRAALRTAGAIDAKDRWVGGALVVVQTGDVLDRGDDEQAILDLVAKLELEAKAAGGAFIMLLGNHELMNGAGDLRYVTAGGMSDFDDVPDLDTTKWQEIPERARKRMAALAPGGPYARKLATHNVIAIVGDTIFSHAGVLGDWVTQVDAVNQSSRCWLDGQSGGPEDRPPALASDESPVWTRAVGLESADCAQVKASLDKLGVKRMVVGHTVQQTINAICDGAVWRIDVGLAKGYGGPIEVLELTPDAPPKVLRGER
ncbi:MAG TPA: metallophosphoesterase [Kofleriaceae bacterium]